MVRLSAVTRTVLIKIIRGFLESVGANSRTVTSATSSSHRNHSTPTGDTDSVSKPKLNTVPHRVTSVCGPQAFHFCLVLHKLLR